MDGSIPEQTEQFTQFLADTKIHPLIKAAAAQAWILAIRPFPEGNERLARLLSNVILIRAGYGFFGDISISAALARSSYNYFRAIANTLRIENGADLTYFLEYYLTALSDAVIEMRRKREQAEKEAIEKEKRLAQQRLSAETGEEIRARNLETVMTALRQLKEQHVESFTFIDLLNMTHLPYMSLYWIVRQLETESQLVVTECTMTGTTYAFPPSSPSDDIKEEQQESRTTEKEIDISRDALVLALQNQQKTGSDNSSRVAAKLLDYLQRDKYSFTSRELALELGITAICAKNCVNPLKQKGLIISLRLKSQNVFGFAFAADSILMNSETEETQTDLKPLRKYLREMVHTRKGTYACAFAEQMLKDLEKGKTEFTSSDFITRLKLHPKTVNGYLRELKDAHLLTLIPVTGVRNIYKVADEKTIYADLQDDQKDTLQLLYDLFGEDSFSTEMVVSRLDYSEGQASGILQQFTLLRLLDSTSGTDDTDYYKICVNPTDNPECFKKAA